MPHGKANILVVDDRPEKLLALEAVLEDLGENIVRAYSGREALRHVLNTEFAVILLDVNMPGMDGFETASLIRQRQSTAHLPIIFITAFGDEIHAGRGYSLGAVDYILTPVIPEVLRTKVAVFVDLYKKREQVRRQADSLRRRAAQLQKLAAASVAINGALSVEKMLQITTDSARDIVGAHQAITLFLSDPHGRPHAPGTQAISSFSDKYAQWRGRPLRLDAIANTLVARSGAATRLSLAELRDHPDWEIVGSADIPPIEGGMLAAPLTGRDGDNLGVIYLCDRLDGEFTNDDEAVLVQLAQMASIAIENAFFAEEREANRIKDEFLATLSHELRTPLNAILGWTQLLRMEELHGECAHGLEVIERNARAQTKLIEDLLDVSRITTGKMRLNSQPILLPPLVQAAIDSVRPALNAKQIVLDARFDASAAMTVAGDADRLQQIFWNLLSNAAKFTRPGGRITVCLESHDEAGGAVARLRVIDTGQGIDPKFLPYIFDRFRQADSTSTRTQGGLGIGLTIVRHIVELHGGVVHAESTGEGLGSTFTVELPLAASGAAPADIPADLPGAAKKQADEDSGADPDASAGARRGPGETVGDEPESLDEVKSPDEAESLGVDAISFPDAVETGDSALIDGAERGSLTGTHILLVDDEHDTREVVAAFLRRADAKVSLAASAAEALEAIPALRPDVLLSDIAMPGQDGYYLIDALRQLPVQQGGGTPAIALTAYAREEDRRRALDAGFYHHLSKPVVPRDLIAAVKRAAAVELKLA